MLCFWLWLRPFERDDILFVGQAVDDPVLAAPMNNRVSASYSFSQNSLVHIIAQDTIQLYH